MKSKSKNLFKRQYSKRRKFKKNNKYVKTKKTYKCNMRKTQKGGWAGFQIGEGPINRTFKKSRGFIMGGWGEIAPN